MHYHMRQLQFGVFQNGGKDVGELVLRYRNSKPLCVVGYEVSEKERIAA
jgi:hypothetical protein